MKRIGVILLILALCMGFAAQAHAQQTALRASVPGEHTLTIHCGSGGGIRFNDKVYTGTLTLSVPRFGSLCFEAVPDDAHLFSHLAATPNRGITVSGTSILVNNLLENKEVSLVFEKKKTDTSSGSSPDSEEDAPSPPVMDINPLYGHYLGTGEGDAQLGIVLDAYGQPRSYELIAIHHEDMHPEGASKTTALPLDNILLIRADANPDSKTEHRRLVLSFPQLVKMDREYEFDSLLFKNGELTIELAWAELLSEDMFKLISMADMGQAEELPSADAFAKLPPVLPENDLLKNAYIDIHVIPVANANGLCKYELRFNLRIGNQSFEISHMLPSLRIAFPAGEEAFTNGSRNVFFENDDVMITLACENRTLPVDCPGVHEETARSFHVFFDAGKLTGIICDEHAEIIRYLEDVQTTFGKGPGFYFYSDN